MADGFTFTPELDAQVAEAAALLREARCRVAPTGASSPRPSPSTRNACRPSAPPAAAG